MNILKALVVLCFVYVSMGIKVDTQTGLRYTRESCYKKSDNQQRELILSTQPKDMNLEVPQSWDWRNVSGVNYLTMNRNQHIPQYCGGCWAFASTSSISDRIKIQRKAAFPDVNVAPQHLIDCNGGGTCDGGDPGDAFAFINENGIVDETCKPYQAQNLPDECSPACKTCNPDGTCQAIPVHTNITVTEYGSVRGAKDMMAEIYARGPIACSIDATSKLEAYTSGIFKEFKLDPLPNHIISIIGWGVQDSTPYWIVRNSWGSYYGEGGFFNIVQGSLFENLGIELDCNWAVPSVSFA
ncbi:hypothetical protein ACTFIW_010465 [Dictyostelium discoideum]